MFSPSVNFFFLGALNNELRPNLGDGWDLHSATASAVQITGSTDLASGLYPAFLVISGNILSYYNLDALDAVQCWMSKAIF